MKKSVPKDIKLDELVTDISCHPHKNVLVSAEISGDVKLYEYTLENNNIILKLNHHKKSCRSVKFSRDGNKLYTASKDKCLCTVDLVKQSLVHTHKNAHSSPVYSMTCVGDSLLATGDDDGHVKVWDTRTHKAVMQEKQNDDFISDIAEDGLSKNLFATSGDGTLSVYNLRKSRFVMQSETCSSEMLAVAVMKQQSKVICGTGNKALNIFSWGEWGDISDRFPGFKGSVDCMVPLDDDILCTGSSDGAVRVVNILPNRFLGVIGRHDGFPVEKVALSHDKKFIVSSSHDQVIKFWDLSSVSNKSVKANEKGNKIKKNRNLNARQEDDFFYDLKKEEEEKVEEEKSAEHKTENTVVAKSDEKSDDADTDDNDNNSSDDSDESGLTDKDSGDNVVNNTDSNQSETVVEISKP